jgi:hypothetical protein
VDNIRYGTHTAVDSFSFDSPEAKLALGDTFLSLLFPPLFSPPLSLLFPLFPSLLSLLSLPPLVYLPSLSYFLFFLFLDFFVTWMPVNLSYI